MGKELQPFQPTITKIASLFEKSSIRRWHQKFKTALFIRESSFEKGIKC